MQFGCILIAIWIDTNRGDSVQTDLKPAGRGPFAVKLAELQSTDVVLNVGCFDGALERHYLRGKVRDYRGVDMNAQAVQLANRGESVPTENGEPRFKFAPAEKLPFSDATFDKVFCLDTLEHVEDETQALREIARVLKPGGTLVLSVPHDFLNFLDPDELTRGARNLVRKYLRKKPLLNHPKHKHYSESALRALLKDFEIERVHKSGTPVFWSLAMLYTAVGLPEKLTNPLRKITAPIENLEYALGLPTGFNVMVRAVKKHP